MSIIHHACIVLFGLWLLNEYNCCHPVAYFTSLVYLYLVHERYAMRLRKKLQYEERKQSYRRRVLTDSETVQWLNHAVEKIWPVCMEQIASQKILLPIIPWFLEKYKPWTAKEAVVQHLYLGRNPPIFSEVRVLRQSPEDDHLVLLLGMNFLTAEDMNAIIAVKLRKRLGFGMWAKLHMTGMHVEGKLLIGIKFVQKWPFLGRLRVCFAEPPYFQMTVKPIFTHGIDVTEVPGIAGWLDNLLSNAFEQTLVQPNMLVVDVEKFASHQKEPWFSVDVKDPLAFVKVEVIEGADMLAADLNGLSDPYVKGELGPYRFKTKVQKKTLSPKWLEEFRIPIITWDAPNVLNFEVCDKDHFIDDALGKCSVNINDLRNGQRYDTWIALQYVKTGRLHIAITVLEENKGDRCIQGDADSSVGESLCQEERANLYASEQTHKGSFSSRSSEKTQQMADKFEPIHVEGQKETGVWIQHPGSEVSPSWEHRKGKGRHVETAITKAKNDPDKTIGCNTHENHEHGNSNPLKRGLRKISMVLRRHRKDDQVSFEGDALPSPYANVREIGSRKIGVNLVVDNGHNFSPEWSGSESPGKGKVKDKAKMFLKHARSSAKSLKHVLSGKGSMELCRGEIQSSESDSSDDDSLPASVDTPNSVSSIPIIYHPMSSSEVNPSPKSTYKGGRLLTDSSDTITNSGNAMRETLEPVDNFSS